MALRDLSRGEARRGEPPLSSPLRSAPLKWHLASEKKSEVGKGIDPVLPCLPQKKLGRRRRGRCDSSSKNSKGSRYGRWKRGTNTLCSAVPFDLILGIHFKVTLTPPAPVKRRKGGMEWLAGLLEDAEADRQTDRPFGNRIVDLLHRNKSHTVCLRYSVERKLGRDVKR